ncbi:hypothetical protein [Shewanella sp. GD04112]|nr:hypothetical protein [Shewanella sp. GD04112]MDH0446662.1 hypothetical protein [Shewanella sp. GD04112]
MYTQVILSSLTKENTDLEKAIKLVNAKDLNLSGSILANKVWSIKQKRITKVSAKSQKAVEKQLLAQ